MALQEVQCMMQLFSIHQQYSVTNGIVRLYECIRHVETDSEFLDENDQEHTDNEFTTGPNGHIYLVMEYMNGGNLFHFIEAQRPKLFSVEIIATVARQVATCLAYLHNVQRMMHRDIKPENILLHLSSNGTISVKLADFSLARCIPKETIKGQHTTPASTTSFQDPEDGSLTSYVSTRWYRAPEILYYHSVIDQTTVDYLRTIGVTSTTEWDVTASYESPAYGCALDIFAFGCVIAELFLLKPLFPGADNLDQWQRICALLGIPNFVSATKTVAMNAFADDVEPTTTPVFPVLSRLGQRLPMADITALDFCASLLNVNPDKRSTAQQALSHAFLRPNQQEAHSSTTSVAIGSPSTVFSTQSSREDAKGITPPRVTPHVSKSPLTMKDTNPYRTIEPMSSSVATPSPMQLSTPLPVHNTNPYLL